MAKIRLRLPTALEELQFRNKKIPLDSFIVRSVEVSFVKFIFTSYYLLILFPNAIFKVSENFYVFFCFYLRLMPK